MESTSIFCSLKTNRDLGFVTTRGRLTSNSDEKVSRFSSKSADFSNVDSIEDPKKKETKISGKLEFIDKQIVDYSEQRQKLVKKFEMLISNKTTLDKALIMTKFKNELRIHII